MRPWLPRLLLALRMRAIAARVLGVKRGDSSTTLSINRYDPLSVAGLLGSAGESVLPEVLPNTNIPSDGSEGIGGGGGGRDVKILRPYVGLSFWNLFNFSFNFLEE
tara:strand:- start:105 stop:422 length:318 start_codon:yes stop_codon:yes gene_type:complete